MEKCFSKNFQCMLARKRQIVEVLLLLLLLLLFITPKGSEKNANIKHTQKVGIAPVLLYPYCYHICRHTYARH